MIVGLGNPGSEYAGTRHNIGFEVVNVIAMKNNVDFSAGRGEFVKAVFQRGDEEILLVKPLTYMNNSGMAVLDVIDRYELPLNNVLIVLDDFHLELGKIRIRLTGSDGGHNGLASILYQVQTDELPRLRCGIKNDLMPLEQQSKINFVLSTFPREEEAIVRTMIQTAADACYVAATQSVERAMNLYNNINN
ncbi:MAG: aminoacyl-tRNA hydrolase [Bacteroidota bacterium]